MVYRIQRTYDGTVYTRNEWNIVCAEGKRYNPNSRGIACVLYRALKKYGHKLAQFDYYTNEKYTYSELFRKSIRCALWLKYKGVKPYSVVCILCENCCNAFIVFISALLIGAVTTVIDPILPEEEILHLLGEIKNIVKIIFVNENCKDIVYKYIYKVGSCGGGEHRRRIIIVPFDKKFENFYIKKYHLHENIKFNPFQPTNNNKNCMIFLSSGSSGLPKGICLNHNTVLTWTSSSSSTIKNNNNQYNDNRTYYSLIYQSLYWISTGVKIINSITSGRSLIICGRFNKEKIWYQLKQFKCNTICLLPSQAIDMCMAKRPIGINFSFIKFIVLVGGPISESQLIYLRNNMPTKYVYQVYGQTETGGMTTTFHNYQGYLYLNRPTSCGLPIKGFKMKIVDLTTEKALGPHQPGELWVKSKILMNCYLNQKPSKCFTKDGWFKTGDMLYYDEDLCFYHVDRIKELLIFRDQVIWPAYIERELSKHPAIKEVVVIGVHYEIDGDHILALIKLNDGFNKIKEQDFINYVEKALPLKFHLTEGVKIVKEFPRTAAGKINRFQLRLMYKK